MYGPRTTATTCLACIFFETVQGPSAQNPSQCAPQPHHLAVAHLDQRALPSHRSPDTHARSRRLLKDLLSKWRVQNLRPLPSLASLLRRQARPLTFPRRLAHEATDGPMEGKAREQVEVKAKPPMVPECHHGVREISLLIVTAISQHSHSRPALLHRT